MLVCCISWKVTSHSRFSPSHFRSFLLSKDGNPNKRNMHNETSLHLLCMGPQIMTSEGALQPRISRPYEDKQRRAECLQLILVWTGAKLDQGEYERADVNATDNKKNTCLHYAAASGMKLCVEVSFFSCLHSTVMENFFRLLHWNYRIITIRWKCGTNVETRITRVGLTLLLTIII